MLKEFIKEYKNTFEYNFDSGFKGEFDRLYANLLEPKFHPSNFLVNRLNFLNSLYFEPPLVAIVGQFSSGKSSFLNAILNQAVLPTGIIPVTAKPTFIKYAPQNLLKATFKDGRSEYKNINELANYTDQRLNLKDVSYLSIYLDNPLLKKVNFVDTPGLNSRSDADTLETKKILKRSPFLIWITLIDNAGRQSELDDLVLMPKELLKKSICLLNQKDKLHQSAIENVLKHTKSTYDKLFKHVVAISSKMQIEGDENSGFDEVFTFLYSLKNQDFIKDESEKILDSIILQNKKFICILEELEIIFNEFEIDSQNRLKQLQQEYIKEFALIFEWIKDRAKDLASEINAGLVKSKKSYFKSKRSLFCKDVYERIEYELISVQVDDVLQRLIYNDSKLIKVFKRFRLDLANFEEKIINDLNLVFLQLKDKVLSFKAKYESLRKGDELHSDILFANIRKFSSQVYALFLNDYEKLLLEKYSELRLFFDEINIKIITNYQNAIKLCISFIEEKCLRASRNYEKDPISFSLYYPKENEINERILLELSYYEFENHFIGNKTFIDKMISSINKNFMDIKSKNIDYINTLKQQYKDNLDQLKFKFS